MRLVGVLEAQEASVLRGLVTEVRQMLDGRSAAQPVDELAARRRRRVQPWLAGAAAAAVIGVAAATWQPWDEGTSGQQVTATEQVLRADDAQRLVEVVSDCVAVDLGQ